MTYHGEDSATADDASVFISHLARKRLWTPEHLEITAASDGASFNRDVWRIEPQQTEILSQRIGADDALLFVLLNPSARAVLANLPQRHLCCNRCPATKCFATSNGGRVRTLIRIKTVPKRIFCSAGAYTRRR